MTQKFFYIDDNTAVLIAANGSPLLVFITAIKDLIELEGISSLIPALWIYFAGLIFAFCCKPVIEFINDDTKEREKLQYGRNLAIETLKTENLPDEIRRQAEETLVMVEHRYTKLLKPTNASKPAHLRAWFFALSCICFLVATAMLISAAAEVINSATATPIETVNSSSEAA